MREIKFRAWDQVGKKMGLLSGIVSDGRFLIGTQIPIQYTGLKDRDGDGLTELYEGDIIDRNGQIKGDIYESPQVYIKGIDHVIAKMGTKAWRESKSMAMGFGYNYAE